MWLTQTPTTFSYNCYSKCGLEMVWFSMQNNLNQTGQQKFHLLERKTHIYFYLAIEPRFLAHAWGHQETAESLQSVWHWWTVLCTCVDDVNKLWLQGGSAHQEAIHISLGCQLPAVCCCDWPWEDTRVPSVSVVHLPDRICWNLPILGQFPLNYLAKVWKWVFLRNKSKITVKSWNILTAFRKQRWFSW